MSQFVTCMVVPLARSLPGTPDNAYGASTGRAPAVLRNTPPAESRNAHVHPIFARLLDTFGATAPAPQSLEPSEEPEDDLESLQVGHLTPHAGEGVVGAVGQGYGAAVVGPFLTVELYQLQDGRLRCELCAWPGGSDPESDFPMFAHWGLLSALAPTLARHGITPAMLVRAMCVDEAPAPIVWQALCDMHGVPTAETEALS